MTLSKSLNQLAEELNLSEELKRNLDDFVDNYIGSEEEGYKNIYKYKKDNPEKFKPLFRELKKYGKFSYFQGLIRPYSNKGVDNLLSIIDR